MHKDVFLIEQVIFTVSLLLYFCVVFDQRASFSVDHYAFCSTCTRPPSGVINQTLSPICNHLHLSYCLKDVCLAFWVCVCVCVCGSHLHHLDYRSVCMSMLQHRGGPPKNTQALWYPPRAVTHTYTWIYVFITGRNHRLLPTPVFSSLLQAWRFGSICVCRCLTLTERHGVSFWSSKPNVFPSQHKAVVDGTEQNPISKMLRLRLWR